MASEPQGVEIRVIMQPHSKPGAIQIMEEGIFLKVCREIDMRNDEAFWWVHSWELECTTLLKQTTGKKRRRPDELLYDKLRVPEACIIVCLIPALVPNARAIIYTLSLTA